VSCRLKIERSRRVSRQKFTLYNRLGVAKFARCNVQTLPAFFDWSTPIFFHFLGIFFVKFESAHPQALTTRKVHCAALFIIDFNLQLAELLAKSLVHSPDHPVCRL
jgi:hypothetical protein